MEQQREQMEQLKDERFVHLQALMDMDGQLEAMDQDLEAANELIQMLQQPAPRQPRELWRVTRTTLSPWWTTPRLRRWTRWSRVRLQLVQPWAVMILTRC
jgi:hypothetical protein